MKGMQRSIYTCQQRFKFLGEIERAHDLTRSQFPNSICLRKTSPRAVATETKTKTLADTIGVLSIIIVRGGMVGRGAGWVMFRPGKPPRIFGFGGLGSVVNASLLRLVVV